MVTEGSPVAEITEQIRRERDTKTAQARNAEAERRQRMAAEASARQEEQDLRGAEAILRGRAKAHRRRPVTDGCLWCGATADLRDPVRYGWPDGPVVGSLCGPCEARNTRNTTVEAITRRLWEERPDLLETLGWRPYPTRAAAQHRAQQVWGNRAYDHPDATAITDEDLTFDVVADWQSWTYAHRVLKAREAEKSDPPPPRRPFGWLTTT